MTTPAISRRTDYGLFLALVSLFWAIVLIGVMEKQGATPKMLYWLIQPGQATNLYGWKLAQYKMDYFQYGFVKRGLIANIFHGFPQPYWYYATLLFNGLIVTCLAAFSAYFILAVRKTHGVRVCILLTGSLFFSSLSVVNIGADFGRFDYVNFVVLLFTLTLIRHGRIWLPVALTAAALLIHEAYFFYGVPLLFLYSLDQRLEKGLSLPRAVVGLCPLAAAVMATLICLKLFGRFEPGLPELAHRIMLPTDPKALLVWTREVTNNFQLVEKCWQRGDYSGFEIAIMFFVLTCVITLLTQVARRVTTPRLSLLAPLFVLPLYGIGIDYARWTELFYLTGFIALGFAMVDHRVTSGTLNTPSIQLALICLILLPTVPFGTKHALGILYGQY